MAICQSLFHRMLLSMMMRSQNELRSDTAVHVGYESQLL
jgi:hypothetical protein